MEAMEGLESSPEEEFVSAIERKCQRDTRADNADVEDEVTSRIAIKEAPSEALKDTEILKERLSAAQAVEEALKFSVTERQHHPDTRADNEDVEVREVRLGNLLRKRGLMLRLQSPRDGAVNEKDRMLM